MHSFDETGGIMVRQLLASVFVVLTAGVAGAASVQTMYADVVAQERCLQFKLVWLDDQSLKTPRDHLQGSEQNDQIATNSEHGETRRVRRSDPDQYTN